MIGTTVYYFGNDPDGFADALEAAVEAGGTFGINGLVGTLGTDVTAVAVDAEASEADDAGQVPAEPPADDQDTDTDQTQDSVDNDRDIAGVEAPPEDGNVGGNDTKVGTAIGVTAAGLAVVLFGLLFVGRRRRNAAGKAAGGLGHRQFTDDEDDLESFHTDMEAEKKFTPIAQVVSDAEDDDSGVIVWEGDEHADNNVMAIYTKAPPQSQEEEESELTPTERQALANHSCSSPSCKICEMKTQEGVTFIPTPRSPATLSPTASRSYLADDTVDL